MPDRARIVIDTKVFVSRLLSLHSPAARAVQLAMQACQLIVSIEALQELEEVSSRPKLTPYVSPTDKLQFFHLLRRTAIHIDPIHVVVACRDPKDDKFLSLAIAGRANILLSGDHDLLSLHPFRGISILNPRQYLDQSETSSVRQ